MRGQPRSALVLLVVALAIGGAAYLTTRPTPATRPPAEPASWLGLVGAPRGAVSTAGRAIVVLKTPSVAERVHQQHGYATEIQERTWSASAGAAQKEVLLRLTAAGIPVHPDYEYTRVIDGFSAELDSRAVSLLEQMPEVAGVYPVRVAYPAAVSTGAYVAGHQPDVQLPGYNGRGVTIALLDTGVDATHPYLRGRVLPGIDEVGDADDAAAQANPQDPSEVEQHGTELAGILVGAGGPDGLHGVAPGATVLPLRVAGWQADRAGNELVYGRTDQLIAGLDRAVDPNGDGDAHDAVRIALVGLAEPYGAFTDGPAAMAVQGALELNTAVVAPAGNDGAAGPAFGSVAGPAGAPAALAVGATDGRASVAEVRVVLRRGLDVILDRPLPLVGSAAPSRSLTLAVGPGRGQAAVLAAGADPERTVAEAARAGSAAVLLYGAGIPAGGLRLAASTSTPAVVVPAAAAAELLAAQRAGIDVEVALGPARSVENVAAGRVAGFSSRGLAFDGGAKPNLAAPGVSIATSQPGPARYATVNGTSVAAATVAGAAALLAQFRPALAGPDLESLLGGYAAQTGDPVTAVGSGALDLGASAVGELASDPLSLGFGLWGGKHWHATRTVTVRNVSTRRVPVNVVVAADNDSEALRFLVSPTHFALAPGKARRVKVSVLAPAAPDGVRLVTGTIRIGTVGTETLRVPWALLFRLPAADLLGHVSLSQTSFAPSDAAPSILTVRAGAVVRDDGTQIVPVRRLDILLYTASGKFLGVMARLNDLLPGSYSFGITGRGPTSARLKPGSYELRLAAWPTLPLAAKPDRAQVTFTIQ